MADIFLSYARSDRSAVVPIVSALEAEGFSVWWDPEIRPGEAFDAVIERELRAAACVIVVWSNASVGSKWVRSEATDAEERNALAPIRIDDARLPVAFKLNQTEDLRGWSGDRDAEPWQRLMLQARALAGRESATSAVPRAATAASLDDPPPPTAPPMQSQSQSQSQSMSAPVGSGAFPTILAAVALTGAWFFTGLASDPVLSTTVGLAALAFVLFRAAEQDLAPGMKAMVRRWFLPVDGQVDVNPAEAFLRMFEAVFGKRHFTWFCFFRSALLSIVTVICSLFIIDYLFYQSIYVENFDGWVTSDQGVASTLTLILVVNTIGDFVSLYQTRLFLGLALGGRISFSVIVVFDVLFSISLFVIVSYICLFPSMFALGFAVGPVEYVTQIGGVILDAGSEGGPLLAASLLTSALTSIWLWLALFVTPLARLLVWSRTTGVSALGKVLDVQRKPVAALGYVSAALILLIGFAIWGGGQAVAAFADAPGPNALD